jgi:hypothetical protein
MEKNIIKKGVWIEKENPFYYLTWLSERVDNVIGFLPFKHSHEPMYMGSVGFIKIEDLQSERLSKRMGRVNHGLLQNHFYPLGSCIYDKKSEFLGKGLARKIEFEIAKELLKQFPKNLPIVIGASSDSHLAYCERVGFTPFKAMRLDEYVRKLNR